MTEAERILELEAKLQRLRRRLDEMYFEPERSRKALNRGYLEGYRRAVETISEELDRVH